MFKGTRWCALENRRMRMTPIREWCKKRKVGTTTAYQLLKDKKLRAVKLGNRTFITDEEDERFIKSLPAYEPQYAGE
jgi:hypothetical protein